MKVVKPQKLSVLHRAFEQQGRHLLAISVLAFVPLSAHAELLPEQALWRFVAEELGGDAVLDDGMPKLRGEMLVHGTAYPAGGKPARAVRVTARLGNVKKSLLAVGDRHWTSASVSEPQPFAEMPLRYDRAFGGAQYPNNPGGRGHLAADTPHEGRPLPNVEDPARPVRSPSDCPALPAGFGPYDLRWPQRQQYSGTFDQHWLKNRYPALPDDADWALYNAAPEDQRIEGFFRGDEEYQLENLHPQRPIVLGRLPGFSARAFVNLRREKELMFREVPLRLDTAWLFPHAERAVLIYRGVTAVTDEDAEDVAHLLVAAESAAAPRERDHYRQALATRIDPKRTAAVLLRERDLLPPPRPDAPQPAPMPGGVPKPEGLLRKNLQARVRRQLESQRQALLALGIDPGPLPAAAENPDEAFSPEKIPDVMADVRARVAAAMEQRKLALEKARAVAKSAGKDLDALIAEAKKQQGGPPKLDPAVQIAALRAVRDEAARAGAPTEALDAKLADPKLVARLEAARAGQLLAYRRYAQHFPPAAPRTPGEARALGETARDAFFRGESLAERDLTGADLSGLVLRRADLRGALLEGANLTDTDLSHADLRDAVLARANLARVDVSNAKLAGANLAAATLTGARCAGADLSGATLETADLSGADFSGANLSRADLSRAKFREVSLAGVRAVGIRVIEGDLRGLRAQNADFSSALLLRVDASGADFTGATLNATVFLEAVGEGAVFTGAVLENLRLVKNCRFAGARFERARLHRANLRDADLTRAVFDHAAMDGADLSGATLCHASFYRAVARGARFVRADLSEARMVSINLMEAVLQKATIRAADLRGANLFRADFARVRGRAQTMADALTRFVRITPRST